jgi:hypothetical protein
MPARPEVHDDVASVQLPRDLERVLEVDHHDSSAAGATVSPPRTGINESFSTRDL